MISTSHFVLLFVVLILTIAVSVLVKENCRLRAAFSRPLPQTNAPQAPEIEILQRVGGDWLLHSTRPEGHRDIAEALDTPGLAIRRGGVVLKGRQ